MYLTFQPRAGQLESADSPNSELLAQSLDSMLGWEFSAQWPI